MKNCGLKLKQIRKEVLALSQSDSHTRKNYRFHNI